MIKDKTTESIMKLYNFIKQYKNENGFIPSYREMLKAGEYTSTGTIKRHLELLEHEGLIIVSRGKNRAIELAGKTESSPFVNIPLIGNVAAGSPILAIENIEGFYPLPQDFFGNNNSMFMLRICGDSMIEAGIFNDDLIVVRQQNDAKNGDIVVACIEDSATVKTFYKEKDFVRLHPENSALEDIIVTDDLLILGVVCGSIRRF
ncbi:MAG: transcriptional repressor LexA [Clostridia bacterium]|nr:transcriptional repressor LexA [Clostridia bacterium]